MITSFVNTVKRIGSRSAKSRITVNLVRYLPARERGGRVFVIGDLHGELNALMSALQAIDFDFDRDKVIFTGDLHDRGNQSAECLDLLQEPWASSTLGNHELMLLMAIDKEGEIDRAKSDLDLWMANGGEWALDAPPQTRARWRKRVFECVPQYWIVERRDGKKLLVCHAEPEMVEIENVIAIKNRMIQIQTLKGNPALWGRRTLSIAERSDLAPYIKDQLLLPVDGVYFSVHGHTCVNTASWIMNRLFIDTGAVLANRLTLVDIDQIIPGQTTGISAWDIYSGTMQHNASVQLHSVNQSLQPEK